MKFLLLIGVVWVVLFWSLKSDDPIISWQDAARTTFRDKWWLLALAGVEVVRQLHYLTSASTGPATTASGRSRSSAGSTVASAASTTGTATASRRVVKVVFARHPALALVLAAIFDATARQRPVRAAPPPVGRAAVHLPARVLLPVRRRSSSSAIFWFLSRGGVDVYFPDDIKTRFTDVWGQDAVLERVKENIVFLENPEAIEAKGGYVPSGILLWGPPGTGKTLMAEAVAGETGKPYVFVDPGAFINMFMGVGILKVKSLFRKLRKLALRYGGVIVFFDEADSLGNRGDRSAGRAGWARRTRPSAVVDGRRLQRLRLPGPPRHELDAASAPSRRPRPRRRRRRSLVIGAGMGGGGGRHGHAAGAAHRDVRPEEAARLRQPVRAAGARHAAQAAAQVPHPAS